MNGLTAGLAAAQHALSPVYSLSVTAAARSTAWQGGGDAWETVAAFPAGLATWNSQSIATDAAAGSTGILRAFLSWKEGRLACQFVSAVGFDLSSTWSAPSVVSVATFTATVGISAPKPAVVYEGGRWHLYYRLPDGNIYYRSSTNNGSTWSAAATIYGGGDAIGDLFACHLAASNIHLLQFSTAPDAWRPRGMSRLGYAGSWSLWATHGSATGWLPAGLVAVDGATVKQLYAADVANPYAHYLGAITCTLNVDGTLATRSGAFTILWLVEGAGAVRPLYHCVGRGFGGWLHTCQEEARTRAYLCAGAIAPETLFIEEPIPLTAEPLPAAPREGHTIPLAYGNETLLVGLATVQRSLGNDDSFTVSDHDIIAYRYDAPAMGPGTLEMIVRPGSPLATRAAGWGLWITRTCAKESNVGSVTLGFRIQRVERRAAFTRLSAVDALGILAATVARRPFQFAGYAFTHARAIEALAGWAGLPVTWETTVNGDAPLLQWNGGEEGLRALERLLRRLPVTMRSRVGAAGEAPALALCAAESAPAYAYGAGGHPLIGRTYVDDGHFERLAVAQGVAVANDPSEGDDWAMAYAPAFAAARSPMLRPRPAYHLNRRLESAGQAEFVAAWLAREGRRLPAGWIDTQANLALEPNDRISVEGEDFYVSRVVERWRERRLVQRVELAAA